MRNDKIGSRGNLIQRPGHTKKQSSSLKTLGCCLGCIALGFLGANFTSKVQNDTFIDYSTTSASTAVLSTSDIAAMAITSGTDTELLEAQSKRNNILNAKPPVNKGYESILSEEKVGIMTFNNDLDIDHYNVYCGSFKQKLGAEKLNLMISEIIGSYSGEIVPVKTWYRVKIAKKKTFRESMSIISNLKKHKFHNCSMTKITSKEI
ncbi:hypothetical protein I3271_03390 [Photobacterium leiognathi]|uniref:hypothetical protein n=1 Tax=Photobacterium leiognathi TaxID=553611 RepID=UPI001EE0C9E2|nr:hypothetical protein [Photobacterium leiognathi]MCG3883725.1 hypothetical protein [Photobacterium leiognathi]